MASPRSYYSSASATSSSANLAPPSPTPMYKQQRRMTVPSLPPPSAIDIPEPVYGSRDPHRRSPSPLRNSFTLDADGDAVSEDGSDDEVDAVQPWGQRPESPSPSLTQMAATFAQRVGSLVNGRVGHLPTDAELEAEAERERARSRREAERILTQEAEERRVMEDKVLAMLQQTPSRPRAQTMPPLDGSPTTPQKDGGAPGWWIAAKSRLTPTKEPLTPAQQVVQDAKEREKKEKKEAKKAEKQERRAEKERRRSGEWPTTPEGKFNDPALAVLTTPPRLRSHQGSPASSNMGPVKSSSLPPSLAPSPLRALDLSKASSQSPSRDPPPLYAQFNPQGVLDVPGTLLTIARRFEKLEKWTVGHVRALEERMSDVERWLVEKEHERERESLAQKEPTEDPARADQALQEVREEIVELQGRIGELGREMAKLATAPANLSNGPSARPQVSSAPSGPPSNFAVPTQPPPSTPRRIPSQTHSRRESMSPTFVPPGVPPKETPRSRLPYPTGDYTSPPESGTFASPPGSPQSAAETRARPMSIAGLPALAHSPSSSSLTAPTRALSPPTSTSVSPSGLVAPPNTNPRASVSPTPRKRYTVALDAPIMKRSESPMSMSEDSEVDQDETIGRAAARRNGYSSDAPATAGHGHTRERSGRTARPVSMMPPGANTTPLRIRARSQSVMSVSTDDEGTMPPLTPGGTGRFVDPLVLRREKKEKAKSSVGAGKVAAAAARRKVPVRELAAFFSGDSK